MGEKHSGPCVGLKAGHYGNERPGCRAGVTRLAYLQGIPRPAGIDLTSDLCDYYCPRLYDVLVLFLS